MDSQKEHLQPQIKMTEVKSSTEHKDHLPDDADDVCSQEGSEDIDCENHGNDKQSVEERWEDVPLKVNANDGQINSLAQESQKQVFQKQESPAIAAECQLTPNKQNKKSQKLPFKIKTLSFNSKSIYAALDLLREQFSSLMPPSQGYIKISPNENKKDIIIYYRKEQNLQQIIAKIEDLINDINFITMNKPDVENGMQLSYKYYRNLIQNRMTYFNDQSISKQGYKTVAYYLAGRVDQSFLQIKRDSMKNTRYCWINLNKFPNSRSYRAIIRHIFDMPEIRVFIKEKLNSREIQVSSLRKGFPEPLNYNKNKISALLTLESNKKVPIDKSTQQLITDYICQQHLVFCFTVVRKSSKPSRKYTPKLDRKNLQKPTSYLFIILKKQHLDEVRDKLISEIESMRLNISGRRIFSHFNPSKQDIVYDKNYKFQHFPKRQPYSWTYTIKNGQVFNWKPQIRA